MFCHFIQHITQPHTVCRRNRNRFTDTKVIELINIHHKFLDTIYLIHNKDNRFAAASEHICHLRIGIHQSLMNVCDKDDNICRINGNLCLLSHLRKDDVTAVRLNTACIDHGKCLVQPCHICINSVSCNAGCIFYNRNLLTCQRIKQCGFTYIRPAHYRYYRFAHISVSFLSFYGLVLRSDSLPGQHPVHLPLQLPS